MAALYRNSGIVINRGDTDYLDVPVTVGGQAQDVTGWVLWFTAKRRLTDADANAVIQKNSMGAGVTILNPLAGTVQVMLSPSDTAALPAQAVRLYADVQGKDGAGHIFTLDSFTFTVRADVTVMTV